MIDDVPWLAGDSSDESEWTLDEIESCDDDACMIAIVVVLITLLYKLDCFYDICNIVGLV